MESIIIQQQQLFYAQQIQNILTMFVISAFSSSSMNHNRNNKIINFAVWIKKVRNSPPQIPSLGTNYDWNDVILF